MNQYFKKAKLIKTLTFYFLLFTFYFLLSACQTVQKTDLRTLAPAETLIYLETNDLGETLQTLTNNKSFQQLTKTTPNFSALKNTQIAVVVTGFETSEKQLTDESAILNFKPRFAMIADTHTWESTAISLVENQIGRFAKENYGDDVKLDKGEKNGIKFFHWTSKDNRKIFASITGSLIYIGNDETIIDKCLAVKKGEGDNLLKNESLSRVRENVGENNLAIGYISPDGIAQLANLAGVSTAINASEEDLVRSFIAKILPTILQKTAKEASWTARKTEQGIEDKIFIKTDTEISSIWKETLAAKNDSAFQSAQFLPNEVNSFTRYNLQNSQLAWKSILLTTSKQLDAVSGKILTQVSGSFFEPYGVENIETFLSAVGTEIVTANFDEEGDKSVVIAEVKDEEILKKSITKEINFKTPPTKQGIANLWLSEDKTLSAAFVENRLILGNSESILKCLQTKESGNNFTKSEYFQRFAKNNAISITFAKDSDSAEKLVEILGEPKAENKSVDSFYLTETRFDSNGMERKTVSDFGLIGMIIEQFKKEN
ncbi:MAG TPA: hypothetical protein PKY82_00025 [Pyrinomonadaceae bacterium]|nr:hypothetical protein [Pyrinomonadaceae bacterium]